MNAVNSLIAAMQAHGLDAWADIAEQQLANALTKNAHNQLAQWQAVIDDLPALATREVILDEDVVRITGNIADVTKLQSQLEKLSPWRKGPFDIQGVYIDTEWRSDFKWNRVAPHLTAMQDEVILDVGCGSGYHGWRMLGAGASLVIGIDPSLLFYMQFLAVRHFTGDYPFYFLPVGIDDVPAQLGAFDKVFSMGVLYHRRSPIDHLTQLKACLKPGGQLVLETLVIEGDEQQVLVPHDRYAKMRNVWFIPSCDALILWLQRSGYRDAKIVDVSPTTVEEQRVTPWTTNESLSDFLDPRDMTKTIEGYPAPVRAVITATA